MASGSRKSFSAAAPTARPRRGRPPILRSGFAPGLDPISTRRALVDPAADARLRRDGFARVPLIDRPAAERLRELYGELHGWAGDGFEADLNNPDSRYRSAVSQQLGDELDALVSNLFVDFTPFLRLFLCKWPGDNSDLYLHRDWMYVDESGGKRTYVVWIALQDVDSDQGQIQVLRHSHRIDPMLRGTHLNGAWIQHEEAIRTRLLTIPAKAGEALIMDNALVHCSLPNHSGVPRVVAAVGMHPAESSLLHYSRADDHTATRSDVDPEFFLRATPQRLMGGSEPLSPDAVLPTGEVELGADDLVRRLNTSVLTRLDNLRRRVDAARDR